MRMGSTHVFAVFVAGVAKPSTFLPVFASSYAPARERRYVGIEATEVNSWIGECPRSYERGYGIAHP